MPGVIHKWDFGIEAAEWGLEKPSRVWKVVYNPAYGTLPACITVFSRNLIIHKIVQTRLDVHFPDNMGRGGNNTLGNAHGDLHKWIAEPAEDADIHPHDHFIIHQKDHKVAIQTAVVALVGVNSINKGLYTDVIEHLKKATDTD
jgi:hypothetical protein